MLKSTYGFFFEELQQIYKQANRFARRSKGEWLNTILSTSKCIVIEVILKDTVYRPNSNHVPACKHLGVAFVADFRLIECSEAALQTLTL